jgi:hypothetical protein
MTAAGLMTRGRDEFALTEQGTSWFGELGIDAAKLHMARRSFARACLDWSERRPHLAGALGAALAARFLELDWIERVPHSRAARLTPKGRARLVEALAVEL